MLSFIHTPHLPHSLLARLALGFLFFVCGLAMLKGGKTERVVAGAAIVNELIYLMVYHPFDDVRAQWEAMWIDLAYALVIAAAAIKWNRTWAKYAAAFELLIVGTHIGAGLDLRIATFFEYWSAAIWTSAVNWSILIGTVQVIWQDRKARRRAAATA
ncbi:MAG TPA: hypothetical protein VFN88_14330 [Caulobacteraceae bacterium]|nr:hypothetical protein [Caulobacteraceae bacterium]